MLLTGSAFSAPFFSQRVTDPQSEDASVASAVIYDFFGRVAAQRCADNITLSSPEVVRSVSWWGRFEGNEAPESVRFHIAFYGDHNGVPDQGNILSSTDVTFTQLNDTGENFGGESGGDDIYVFRANITPTPIEQGEQVWFSVLGDSGEESGRFGWRFEQAVTIGACDVQDLDRDISEMIFDWSDGGSGGIQPNNFSFVLDDEFMDVGASTPVIIAFEYAPDMDEITLSWSSSPTETYRVAWSLDLADWSSFLDTGITPDAGITTTRVFDLVPSGLATEQHAFFRVESE